MSTLGKEIAAGNRPMFMTPDEVTEHFQLGDAPVVDMKSAPGSKKSKDQQGLDSMTMAYKLKDAQHAQSYDGTTSLYDSIKAHGVQTPIEIGKTNFLSRPIVTNGHHRLAVSQHLNPKQFIPMEYH